MKTILEVNRLDFSNKSCIGDFYINGTFVGYSLEPALAKLKENKNQSEAIPAAIYEIGFRISPHFSKKEIYNKKPYTDLKNLWTEKDGLLFPEILNVPERTYIMIHPLNTPEETEGCIGLGLIKGVDRINQSQKAFQNLMLKLNVAAGNKDQIYIHIY